MAGNKVLQILRGTRDKINQCDEPLISGQLLYNMTDNFLYCGKDDTAIKDTLPIHTSLLKDSEAKTAYISATTNQLSIVANTTIGINSSTCEFSSSTNTVFKGKTESTVIPSSATEVVRLKEIQDLDLAAVTGNGFIKSISQTDGKVSATTSDVATTLKVSTQPSISDTSTDVVRGAELAALDFTLTATDGFINSVSQVDGKVSATTTTSTASLQVSSSPVNATDVVRYQEIDDLELASVSGDGFIKNIKQENGLVTAETSNIATTLQVTTAPNTDQSVLRNIDIEVNGRSAYYNAKTTYYGKDDYKYEKLSIWGATCQSNGGFDVLGGKYDWVSSYRHRHIGRITYCLGDNNGNTEYTRCFYIETPVSFYSYTSAGSDGVFQKVSQIFNTCYTIEQIYYLVKDYGPLLCWVWQKNNKAWVPAILYCMTNYKSFCSKHNYINDTYPSWLGIEVYDVVEGADDFDYDCGHVLSFDWAATPGFTSGYRSIDLKSTSKIR